MGTYGVTTPPAPLPGRAHSPTSGPVSDTVVRPPSFTSPQVGWQKRAEGLTSVRYLPMGSWNAPPSGAHDHASVSKCVVRLDVFSQLAPKRHDPCCTPP